MAHAAFENDVEALARLRELIDFLPSSNREQAPVRYTDDDPYVHCALVLDRVMADG